VKRTCTPSLAIGLIAALCLTVAAQASSQKPTQLFAFSCKDQRRQECPRGANPQALIQASDGNFYGATSHGGSQGLGTIFKITPGGKFTRLFTFAGTNGSLPGASLVEAKDGTLYGGTGFGGEFGNGVVFKISKRGSGFQILHSFEKAFGSEIFFSEMLTVGKDGYLYGTSVGGGLHLNVCPYGCGTIFRINLKTGAFKTLHQLNGASDSFAPSGLIQASDGNFYGMTTYNVFRVIPTGTFTVVSKLSRIGYAVPGGGGVVQAPNGSLYGLLEDGGVRLFEVALDGSGFKVFPVIHALQNNTVTLSPLLQPTDENLWLTQNPLHGSGAIVSISPRDGSLLHTVRFDGTDFGVPMAPVIQGADGKLYGTTLYGGKVSVGTSAGVVFSLDAGHPASQPTE
jgi:uncharacterized repeat protein (TIGR03803 family)